MNRAAGTALLMVLAWSTAACRQTGENNVAAEVGKAEQTARACSPRRSSWISPGPFTGVVINHISVDQNGAIYWNGARKSLAEISSYMSVTANMNPQPFTFLQTEMGVPCALVEQVRDEMERRLDCRHNGPCGEGIQQVWEATPLPPGTPPA